MENQDFALNKKFQDIFEIANAERNHCPVRDIICRISDKWTLLAVYALGGFGTMRFNELRHKIGDVSQRMLTVTLRNLENDGFVSRKVYAEVPPRVEYKLTDLGYSLLDQLYPIINWADNNGETIIRSRGIDKTS
jgi:DNA-binding HxlR family transcriptional regulator